MSVSSSFSNQVQQRAERLAQLGVPALSGLYDLTSQRLVRYAVTITRNQHDAEDAVQAVLVKVADQPQRLATARCSWGYLLRMVRNEALGIGRRSKRWNLVGNLTDLLTRRAVDEVELEDTHRAIWQALRTIPTSQAEVVVLKLWEEMTFAEIADVLQLSPNTVASRYQYAMRKLARQLAAFRDEVCYG